MSFKNLEGQTARWIQRLQEYNFTSKHRKGLKHNNADALSRRSCQEECTHCHKVEARAYVKKIRAIAVVAGARAQIVVPRSRVKDVLTELHDGPSGGNLDVNKTLNKVRQRFYWLQARTDIEKWCKQCDTCAASRGPRTRNRGQMHQYNVRAPLERIAIDVAGPFLRSDQGN
jgi:hypothetical protein